MDIARSISQNFENIDIEALNWQNIKIPEDLQNNDIYKMLNLLFPKIREVDLSNLKLTTLPKYLKNFSGYT